MKKLVTAALLVLAAACHKGASMDDKILEFQSYQGSMCLCTDADCAKKVYADWQKWREGTKGMSQTDAQKARIKEINGKFHECYRKIGGGDE